jgi:hypothetical protein
MEWNFEILLTLIENEREKIVSHIVTIVSFISEWRYVHQQTTNLTKFLSNTIPERNSLLFR